MKSKQNKGFSMNRRNFLKIAGAGAAYLAMGKFLSKIDGMDMLAGASMPMSPTLTPYQDSLPIPTILDMKGGGSLDITMDKHIKEYSFHKDLPEAAVTWGYYGAPYLGPTIEAKKDVPLSVKFINNIPADTHPLPVEEKFLMDNEKIYKVRLTPHLHGGFTPPQYDGHPQSWFTNEGHYGENYFSSDITPGDETTSPGAFSLPVGWNANYAKMEYTNQQRAAAIWYHDHGMGSTRTNVYLGLAAYYWIRDEFDTGGAGGLNIPKGEYEVPIVLQDKFFNPDGSLLYPTQEPDIPPGVPTVWIPELFGDVPVVNGKAFPYFDVEPRRYRLRLLNGSNARFYHLWFDSAGTVIPFHMIGSDQGLLPRPVALKNLLLAPGERADVIIDFKNYNGKDIILRNLAKAPYPGGGMPDIPNIMKFKVVKPLPPGGDTTANPATLVLPSDYNSVIPDGYNPLTTPVPSNARDGSPITTRDIVLKEASEDGYPTEVLINWKHFRDQVEESPNQNAVEVWQYINLTGDAHPMHIHLVGFQVLNRQRFFAPRYERDWFRWINGLGAKPDLKNYLYKSPLPPAPEEIGFKDTAKAYPNEILRVIVKFDMPNATNLKMNQYSTNVADPTWPEWNRYNYVHHCHIIEHEDNEMMRPFSVTPVA